VFKPARDATAERVETDGHYQRQAEEHGKEEAAARSEVAALAQSQYASVAQIDEPDRPVKGIMPSLKARTSRCREHIGQPACDSIAKARAVASVDVAKDRSLIQEKCCGQLAKTPEDAAAAKLFRFVLA
jgi:hypothetical protein